MKLSIIIPIYNAEKYLARCLDSLLNQDLNKNNYEIILVNDGSTDRSLIIAQNYEETNSNIIVISQENAGVGTARNNGIDMAKGEYLYFIDPDDYVVKDVFKKLLYLIEDSKLEILTFLSKETVDCNLLTSSTTEILRKHSIKIETGIEYIANKKYQNEVWWYLISRKFLNTTNIRFIEGKWMEDALFTVQLFLKSKRIGHFNLDVHRYVKNPESAMNSREKTQYLRVINDNANAAILFTPLMDSIDKNKNGYLNCIKRLKTRQQSFVFFMMVRMLQSSIKLKEIKLILSELENVNAYPLNSFFGKDYKKIIYGILLPIFNKKNIYLLFFLVVNPLFRLKNLFIELAYNNKINLKSQELPIVF